MSERQAASEGNVQPPLEQRVLLLRPNEFAKSVMWRRQKYAQFGEEATPEAQSKRLLLGQEISILEGRLDVLKRDMRAPNEEDIGNRLKALDQEAEKNDMQSPQSKYLQVGISVRRELLLKRREQVRAFGPLIRTIEAPKWKERDAHGARARKPQAWEQLSPRLVTNPDTYLNEQQEYEWYISTLSSRRRQEVRSLRRQMRPLDDNVRAVVCMPAYKEGPNIYKTLENYAGLVDENGNPFNYAKLRIVVFNNSPEGQRRDNTGEEVRRFMKDHPEVQVDYVKATFDKGVVKIGNIRNIVTAAIIENAARNRSRTHDDLIYVSNDADIPSGGIRKTYVADIIDEFDSNPQMDALAGKIDFPEELMDRVPVQLATRRLWQYKDLIHITKGSGEPFLVGRNSAMRLKMIAAVGNYDASDGSGEDVEIGNKIKWVRRWNPGTQRFERERTGGGRIKKGNRIRYVHRVALDSDPRRDIVRLLGGERIQNQYSVFEKDQSIRGKTGAELADVAVAEGLGEFDRALFEKEAEAFYRDAKGWEEYGGLEAFNRAIGRLGVKYQVATREVNGKPVEVFRLTDTSVLERGLQEHRFRHRFKADFEEYLGTNLRNIRAIRTGANNLVYSVRTGDGRDLIIRMSPTSRNDRFRTEAEVIQLLRTHRIPVPRIIGVETEGKIVKGWRFSIGEKLPGKTLRSEIGERVPDLMLYQAGRVLRKIHDIPITKGYGYSSTKMEGYSSSWEKFISRPITQESVKVFVEKGLLAASDIDEAIRVVQSHRSLLKDVPRRLLHGDFSLGNLLIDETGKITGVLDFENATSGDPLWDFALFRNYTADSTIGPQGMDYLLAGYGKPGLLSSKDAWQRYNMYRISKVFAALQWNTKREWKPEAIQWLNLQLRDALMAIKQDPPRPVSVSVRTLDQAQDREPIRVDRLERSEINSTLQRRFSQAVEWFQDFYEKGQARSDQEYETGRQRYRDIKPFINAVLQGRDEEKQLRLFDELRKDSSISLSDNELRRQIRRLITEYGRVPDKFSEIDLNNPAYRFLVYARNRGRLARYERSYGNLPKDIKFGSIVEELARKQANAEKPFRILDEGGTFDLGIQQLAEQLHGKFPGINMELSSISADDLAVKFADCHRYPVTHKMADVHRLSEVFRGKKQNLIVSEAAYKFFWDPVGAIRETANMLEKGGWAFLGDIQENVSYKFDRLFVDDSGRPMDPLQVISYLNGLNLGYTFFANIHETDSMGDKRRVMTLAIRKDTDRNIELPIMYAKRDKMPDESGWVSPISYIVSKNPEALRSRGYVQVA